MSQGHVNKGYDNDLESGKKGASETDVSLR